MNKSDELIGLLLTEATEKLKQTNTRYRIFQEGRENIITADFDPNRIEIYVNDAGVVTKTSHS